MLVLPDKVRLDASTVCQLKCPSCPTARGDVARTLGTGFLKFDDFKDFIDCNGGIREIELSNWGEIFLNPEIVKIIEYAFLKHVALYCDAGANFTTVSDEVLEALVKYRFRAISCAIDGASQEVYAIYRRQGHFEQVIKNIRKLNAIKKKYNSPVPRLKWQFIIFGHNEGEISKARAMAKDLGMQFWPKLSWGAFYTKEDFSPVKNRPLVRQESRLGAADRSEFLQKYGQGYLQKILCAQMWVEPKINFDGRIFGCCNNIWGDYGQAFGHKIADWFNNEKLQYTRSMLKGQKEMRADIPCSSCAHYHFMRDSGRWMLERDIVISRMLFKFRNSLQNIMYLSLFLKGLSIFNPGRSKNNSGEK